MAFHVSRRPRLGEAREGSPPSGEGNMVASTGARTLSFVLLLCCWEETNLQPINTTSDEILVQEILDPNKSAMIETQRTTPILSTRISTDKNAGNDDNYQGDGSENYHELLDNSDRSSTNDEKTSSNEPTTADSQQVHGSDDYHEAQFSSGEKNSKTNPYDKLSVLDKILQNIGRSSDTAPSPRLREEAAERRHQTESQLEKQNPASSKEKSTSFTGGSRCRQRP